MSLKTALAALATFALVSAAPQQGPNTRIGFHDAVTPHYVAMSGHAVPHAHEVHLNRRDNVTTSLVNVRDIYYIIDLKIGSQTIPVSVDTGSSDTWIVKQPYTCISMRFERPGTKPNCGLGDGLTGTLAGGTIPNVTFGRAYADGTFVSGYFGYDEVVIAGLTAHHQRLAIVNYTYWYGDGRTSGLLGLAYPYMTSLDGSSPDQPLYDPIFTTLWKDKQITPMFSIALSRAVNKTGVDISETSYLALGGLPPVKYEEESWARVKIQNMGEVKAWGLETEEHGLYVITAENYVWGTRDQDGKGVEGLARNETQFPVLVDVGSTLTILPRTLVNKLYAAFDPPAKYMSENGLFYARCDAKIPEFGITFGGQTFFMAPEDLLRQSVRDESGEYCRIGVTDGSDSGVQILGVTWLSNVLAVFDVEHHEMRFARRVKY
ncbi:hypothetical protein OQA88_2551 [Cercophora sp. LCS_1]